MFKQLSAYKFKNIHETRTGSFYSDISLFDEFMINNPPTEPILTQLSKTGIQYVDPEIIDQCVSGRFAHGFIPVKLITYQRVVNNDAVKLAVRRRVAEVVELNRKTDPQFVLGKKQVAEIKSEILIDMIPKSPIKEIVTQGYFKGGELYINAVGKQAETFLKFFELSMSHLWPLDGDADSRLSDYNPEVDHVVEYDAALERLRRYMINRLTTYNIQTRVNDDDVEFQFDATGTFSYELDNEKVTVKDLDLEMLNDEIHHRVLSSSFLKNVDMVNDEYSFKLLANFTFKNIISVSGDDYGGYDLTNVTYHRHTIRLIRQLIEQVELDIQRANQVIFDHCYSVDSLHDDNDPGDDNIDDLIG